MGLLNLKKRVLSLTLGLTMTVSLATSLSQSVSALEQRSEIIERALIPKPLNNEVKEGKFILSAGTSIYVKGNSEEETNEIYRTGQYISNKFKVPTGYSFDVVKGNNVPSGNIYLTTVGGDEALGDEGYKVTVNSDGVKILAYKPEGLFRAVQTLRQLLPADIEKNSLVNGVEWSMPYTEINDKPEYSYRGTMLDVARHFFSVDQVKRYIDNAAQYKINKFHFHLSDDQGWRLQLKGTIGEEQEDLNKLIEIGAQSSVYGDKGGYYTQEEFKEIVEYANERYIEVIPEFDMPGHTWAALVSLNYLNSTSDGKPVGPKDNTKPSMDYDVGYSSFECNNENTYEFVDILFRQISEISPLIKTIHVGGDEAHNTSKEDYSKFCKRVTEIAHSYNMTTIGWQGYDEVVTGDENAICQYWDNSPANGNNFKGDLKQLVSPANKSYIDQKYDKSTELGLSWAGPTSIQQAYEWDPTDYGAKDRIIGIEASLWSETLRESKTENLEFLAFPRLLGLAEIGWTPKETRSWEEYKPRLIAHGERLENKDINYYKDPQIWQTPYEPVNAEWDMEEGQGTVINDKNNKYPGTISGGVTFGEGKNGKGLLFDGSGYVDLGLNDLEGDWSATVWVNKGKNTGTNAALIGGVEGEIKLEQWNNTKKVGITKFGVSDYTFNYVAPEDEWVHLSFVSDSTGTALYVNGKLQDKITAKIAGPAKRIGANAKAGLADSGNMVGSLDEVKIFNRALTAQEVSDLVEGKEDNNNVEAPLPYGPTPTDKQVEYSKEEMAAFVHFGMNTFTDVEWGNGKENPSVYNPTELDPDQWAKVLSENGFKKIILTTKHHDGFSLFDSPDSDHDITNSAINESVRGRDIVKELSDACAKYGLKFGVYLSPWDQNNENYGDGNGYDYNDYYMTQLRKLLTEYGDIAEVWFDGAKGSNVTQDYKIDEWFALVRELQPNALIFSDKGLDVRWIGNEAGYAGEPCWSKIKGDTLNLPHMDMDYLNHGDPEGTHWIMGESDTSLRPGWFFHESQDPKSLEKLVDIYFNSVGKNSTLLLNVPPDKRGLISEEDIARLNEFSTAIKNTFDEDLALNSKAEADTFRGQEVGATSFIANNVTDGNYDSYWTTDNGVKTGSITIDLGNETLFDVISIQEYIPLGQRIERFSVEVYNESLNQWKMVQEGQTIGYKRLIRLAPTTASKIRINILGSQDVPLINNVSVYKAHSSIELESNVPDGLRIIDDQEVGTGLNQIQYEGTWSSRTNETGFYNNSTHWTNTPGAKARLRFEGSKFYMVSATDPNHGTFTISIDGGEPIVVDNYGTGGYKPQQIVYESDTLEYGEHTVEIVLTGNNPHGGGYSSHIDAFYVLDSERGMIEIDAEKIFVNEDAGKVEIPLKRIGGAKGEVSVSFSLESATAIHDQDYQRMIEDVTFADGQTEATVSVILFDNEEMDGNKYFNVRVQKVVGATTGFNSKAKIFIMDDESPVNLAFNKEVTASSTELGMVDKYGPQLAVDGDSTNTRWSSEYSDDQWIQVDLGKVYDINKVNINWQLAYATQYKILVSEDGENYTEVYSEANGATGLKEITFDTVKARYVKMQGVERVTPWGYSIYEFEVYGPEEVTPEPPVEEADKSALKTTIDYANELVANGELEGVVPAVAKEFNDALAEANAVYGNIAATEAEVDASFKRLVNAIWMLEFKQGNKEALQALVDAAKALVEKEYTEDSWAKLQDVLVTAEAVLVDENAMQAELDEVYNNLKNAIDELVKNNVDKSALEALVNKLQDLSKDKYIEATWSAFQTELEKAKEVLINEGATQEQVNDAYNSLLRAYLNLRLIPDKSLLEDLINKVENMDLSGYTKATVNKLMKAVKEGKVVVENKNSTQEQINSATKAINSAVDNLELKASASNNGNNTANNNSSSNGNNTASNNSNNKVNSSNNKKLPATGAAVSSTIIALLGLAAVGGGTVTLIKRKKEK